MDVAAAARLSALLLTLAPVQEDRAPGFDDLPVFLWRQDAEGAPSDEVLEALGGVRLHAKAEAGWLDDRPELVGRTYRGQLAGRLVLHPERGDVPQPWPLEQRLSGLCDPEFRAAWEAELASTLSALDGRYGVGLALGDEPGLTPFGDPLEQASTLYAPIGAEARSRVPPVPAPVGTEEALRLPAPPPGWIAGRTSERREFTSMLEWMADATRREAPGVPVGMLGLGDENAFRGIDLSAVARSFDFVETYPGGWATAAVRTAWSPDEPPDLWRTVFASAAEPADLRHQVHAHHLAGAEALVVWSDRALRDRPDRLAALARSIAEVRGLRAAHPQFPPAPSGVALLRDFPSICAGFHALARNEGGDWRNLLGGWQRTHGALERAEEGTRLLLEDLGVTPGVVPGAERAFHARERFPVLLAVHHRVLSAERRLELALHLANGGWLLTVGPCFEFPPPAPGDPTVHEELHEVGGERYVRLDDLRVAEYPRLRTLSRSTAAVRARRHVGELLTRAGLEPPPFDIDGPEGSAPYLRRWIETSDGGLFCVAHEHRRVAGEVEREPLLGGTVRVEPLDDFAIRWESGRPGRDPFERRLEPGEPAIFTLVPRR